MNKTERAVRMLPCPFCGEPAQAREASNWGGWWLVGCVSLGCDIRPEVEDDSRSSAVETWNTRDGAAP